MSASLKLFISRLAITLALLSGLIVPSRALAQVKIRAEQLERVATLISGKQFPEAEQQLNQILKAAPNDAAALNLFGAIRAQQGRLKEAEVLFLRAIRNDKSLIGARMNLAYLYLIKGEREKTVVELKAVLSLDPANADAAYRLGWLLLSQGGFDECISLVDKVKQSQTLSAPLLSVLGDAYLGKGDAGKAEENYLLALDVDATNADALLGLAQVSQIKGNRESAVAYFDRASKLINSADLLNKMARVALNLNLKSDAVTALKRAVELRPTESSYYFALGVAFLKPRPDLAGAEESFRQFLKLKPEDVQGQVHLAYVLLKQKRLEESQEWLLKSIGKSEATPEAFYYLGLIAQGQNDDARAIELFQKAIQLAPSFSSAHVALGSTYLKLKDYPKAQQALEAGVRLNPDDSKGHYNLAMLFARTKNPEKSQAEMRILARLESQGNAQPDDDDVPAPPSPSPH